MAKAYCSIPKHPKAYQSPKPSGGAKAPELSKHSELSNHIRGLQSSQSCRSNSQRMITNAHKANFVQVRIPTLTRHHHTIPTLSLVITVLSLAVISSSCFSVLACFAVCCLVSFRLLCYLSVSSHSSSSCFVVSSRLILLTLCHLTCPICTPSHTQLACSERGAKSPP